MCLLFFLSVLLSPIIWKTSFSFVPFIIKSLWWHKIWCNITSQHYQMLTLNWTFLRFAETVCVLPSPPLDNIRVMVTVWRLRANIIRTVPCWFVWHNVHSQQYTYVSSSYRSSRLGLSHGDPYAMLRGGCLELYYCNVVEWCWWDSSLIWKTIWLPSVLWHC